MASFTLKILLSFSFYFEDDHRFHVFRSKTIYPTANSMTGISPTDIKIHRI